MKKIFTLGLILPISTLMFGQLSNHSNKLIPKLINAQEMLDSSRAGSTAKSKFQYVQSSNQNPAFDGFFEEASLFNLNGLAIVQSNNQYSVIEQNGKVVYTSQFPLKVSNSGFIRIQKDQLFGLMDRTGKVILEPKYNDIQSVDKTTLFKVVLNQKKGLFAANGQWISEIKWDEIAGGEIEIQEFKDQISYQSEFFSKFFGEFKENFTLLQFFSKNKKEMVSINKNGNNYTMKLISPKNYDDAKIDEDFPFYIHYTTHKKNGKQINTELKNLMGATLYQCQENFNEKNEKSQLQVNFIANLLGLRLDETNKDVKLTEQLVLQVPSPKNSELNLLTIVDLFGKKLMEATLSDEAEINEEIGCVYSNSETDSLFFLFDIGKLKHVAYINDRRGKVQVFQKMNNQFRIFENNKVLFEVNGNKIHRKSDFFIISDSLNGEMTIISDDFKDKFTLTSYPKGEMDHLNSVGKDFLFFRMENINQYYLYDLKNKKYVNNKWKSYRIRDSSSIFLDSEGFLYRYADGNLNQLNINNPLPKDAFIENYNSYYTQISFPNDSVQLFDSKGNSVCDKTTYSMVEILEYEDESRLAFLVKDKSNQSLIFTKNQFVTNGLRSYSSGLSHSGAFVAEDNGDVNYYNCEGLKLLLHRKVKSNDSSIYNIYSFSQYVEYGNKDGDIYKFDIVYNDLHKIYWVIFKNKVLHSGKYKGDFETVCLKSNLEIVGDAKMNNSNQTWVLCNGMNKTYFINTKGEIDSIGNIVNRAYYDREFFEEEFKGTLGLIEVEINENGAVGIWNTINRNWLMKPENHSKLNFKFNPENGVEDGRVLFLSKDTIGRILSIHDNNGMLIFPPEEYRHWIITESESSEFGNLYELKKSDTSQMRSVYYRIEPNLSLVKFTPNVKESILKDLQLEIDYFQPVDNELVYFKFFDTSVLMDKLGNVYWNLK